MKKNHLISSFLIIFFLLIQGENVVAQNGAKRNLNITTDGLSYVTGEQVWCSFAMTEAGSGSHSNLGHIIYGALLNDKGSSIIQARLSVRDGIATGFIPLPASLVSGIYLITAITGDPSITASLKPILVINPNKPPVPLKGSPGEINMIPKTSTGTVLVKPFKLQSGKREKVSIDIDAGEQGNAMLSMSIRRTDALEQFADSLLSGININATMPGNASAATWEGQMIRASIFPSNGTGPASDVRVYVSVIGTEARLAEAVSDANGNLEFLLPILYADAQLVFIPMHKNDKGYRIEFNSDVVGEIKGIELPPLILGEWLAGPIGSRIIEAQAQVSYRPEEKSRLVFNNPDTTDFYGRPDKRYMLDDYIRFPNMEEIITEFIGEVRIRKNGEITELQVYNTPYKKYFEEPALVLIDGIPVTDVRQLMDIDPLKLQSIDVVSRRFFMGTNSYQGIIHYKSYLGNLGGYTLPVDATVYSFEGAQLQTEYAMPDYSKDTDARIPDFRNLLYWSPMLSIDKKGKGRVEVFSADLDGEYKITVNGVSPTGKPLRGEAKITVN